MEKAMSFMLAMMDYFKKPGQTTAEFAAEYRKLDDADKAEFRALLETVGYKISA
jgi:hypothetical protein